MNKVLIDPEDICILEAFKWRVKNTGKHSYVVADLKRHMILLHRVITNCPDSYDVDHINGNGLDNRKCNLRIATRSQNLANTGAHSHNKSGYKGVSFDKSKGKWRAQITKEGRCRNLGRFSDPIEAAKRYDEAAKKLHGEFAYLNFP
jgi:hypothetical protein